MWSALASIAMWVLGLFGIGKKESEAEARERLAREALMAEAEEAEMRTRLEAQEHRAVVEDELRKVMERESGAAKPKPKPGSKLFMLLVGLALLTQACAERRVPTPTPTMEVACPQIPLPPKPDIVVPEPTVGNDTVVRYCFTEKELADIISYAKTLRTLIETYNAHTVAPKQ